MKKILTVSLFAGVMSLLMIGCKSKDSAAGGDPKTVLTAFFEKMSKKDIDGAAKLATKDSKATMDMMKKAIDAAEKMGETGKEKDGTEDFKDMVIGDAKIDGDNATVSVTNKKENRTVDFPLKKEGGDWKVDFTMATLMKMGMDEAKDKDNDLFKDSTDNDSDTLDTNLDNLSDTIRKELDKLKQELKEN
jgi:Domain of unknown function (DUF4878)